MQYVTKMVLVVCMGPCLECSTEQRALVGVMFWRLSTYSSPAGAR